MLRFNQVNGNYVGFGDKTEISEDEKNKFYLPYGEAEETDIMRASLLSLKENVITKKIAYMTVVVSYGDDADIYLFCNLPVGEMHNIDKPFGKQYDDRDLPAFVEKAKTLYGQGKAVAIADIAYSNGGDVKFAKMLSKEIGLFNLAGYAGWNTSSNTLGTVICQSVFYNFYGDTPAHRAFTAERVYEDLGYCAYVRKYIWDNELNLLGCTYCDAKERRGAVAKRAKRLLEEYVGREFPEVYDEYEISDCYMPWKRLFEIGLTVATRIPR